MKINLNLINQEDTLFNEVIIFKIISLIIKKGNYLLSEKIIYKFFKILNKNKIKNLIIFFKFKNFKFKKSKYNFISKNWNNNKYEYNFIDFNSYIFDFINLLIDQIIPIVAIKEKKQLKKNKNKKSIYKRYYTIIGENKLLMLGLRNLLNTKEKKPFFISNLIEQYNNIKNGKSEILIRKYEMYQLILNERKLMKHKK